jgi:hypothetical protein
MADHPHVSEAIEPLADMALTLCQGNGVAAVTLASLTLCYLIAACVHQDEVTGLLHDITATLPEDVALFQRKMLEAIPHGSHIH